MDSPLTSPWKLLRQAWSLAVAKSNILLFLGLGALPQLLSLGFSGTVAFGLDTNWLESTLTDFFSQANGWVIAFLVILLILTIIAAIYLSIWYTAFLYKIYEATVSGSTNRLSTYISSARLVTKRLFITSVKVGFYATLGSLLFIIPGVIVMVRFAFAPFIASIEASSVSPLGESKRLVKNRFWRLLAYQFIPIAFYNIPLSIFQSIHPLLGSLWSLSSPVFGLYFYLVYLDFKRTASPS